MLIARTILGTIGNEPQPLEVDFLQLEWFDTTKRIIRAMTVGGREIGFKNSTNRQLSDGDLLYRDPDLEFCIVVKILPCSCLVFRAATSRQMAYVCFEIGNRHIPIFINEQQEVITAFEKPLFDLFIRRGLQPTIEHRVIERTSAWMIHPYKPVQKKISLRL
ncbi:urease accessory protein UreE [Sphingobacterium faecium]|uniref:urease accessory protein UreE n=1 Tax=Sphingobacterium faecium TaxID=34087 RepID=UPI00320B3E5E